MPRRSDMKEENNIWSVWSSTSVLFFFLFCFFSYSLFLWFLLLRQVEVLWSRGSKKLNPLFPLLVKGRNLYKLKTFRQVTISWPRKTSSNMRPYIATDFVSFCCISVGRMRKKDCKFLLRSTSEELQKELLELWERQKWFQGQTNPQHTMVRCVFQARGSVRMYLSSYLFDTLPQALVYI